MVGAAAAMLVIGGAVAVSCSHGGHGKMTPERMKTIATWKVNDVLDDVDATSAQRKVVLDQTYKVIADFGKLHAQSEGDHEKLIAELVSSQPRADVINAMVDERIDAFRAFMHRSVDALLVANAALSVDQREQLADMAREHMGKN
jgi:protein CpxP